MHCFFNIKYFYFGVYMAKDYCGSDCQNLLNIENNKVAKS